MMKRIVLTFTLLVAFLSRANAASITYDTAAGITAYAATINYLYTVSGSNPFLALGVGEAGTSISVTGATYNGSALTKFRRDTNSTGNELWYLSDPATGAHTLTVTFGGTTSTAMGIVSYDNTNTSTPVGTSYSASATNPVSISYTTTAYGSWLFDCLSSVNTGTVSSRGAGMVNRTWKVAGSGAGAVGVDTDDIPTSSFVTLTPRATVLPWVTPTHCCYH